MNKKTNPKSKTLYSSNTNVDISGLGLGLGLGITNKNQVGGNKNSKTPTKSKHSINIKKSNYKNDSDIDDTESGNDTDDDPSDIDDDVDIDADIDADIDEELKDMDLDDDNEKADSEDDEKSLNDESDNDEKEEKDYIDNDETLKSKCYSKYARMEYDDIDLDELFGDETNILIKNTKLSKPILTKYEFVRLLTDRTKQLAQGAKPMMKNIENLSSKEIAKLELKNKIIPLIIERPVPNSGFERWKLSELEIPEHFFTN